MNARFGHIERGKPSDEGLPYSTYVRAGDFVYVSGLVAFDENLQIVPGGVGAETHQIMQEAIALLAEASCTLDDVVKVQIFLRNEVDFDAFNTVYATYVLPNPPARSTVCAPVVGDALIELDMVAFSPVCGQVR